MTTIYSAPGIEQRLLDAIRAAGLNPDERLPADALGALDHFHTGGREATAELLQLARITREDRVLDLGAGLAGPARLMASTIGCRVVCLDRSPDYCTGAKLLNRLTGLDALIDVQQGSALEIPAGGQAFDAVWVQNVGMSIEDKPALYAEIHRVLKRNGRFVFQEITAGEAGEGYFPLPWANVPGESHLVPAKEIRSSLLESGFIEQAFEDATESELNRSYPRPAPGDLSLAVFVERLPEKARNQRRALQEGRIRVVRGVFRSA